MEQIQKPDCRSHPYNKLNIHCPVHNYMVCSTCTRDTHKTCFENEDLKQKQQRNATVENIMSKTKDLLDAKIDILLKLETWKITTKQEIESLRERINTHLDQIQRRSEEAMENIYKQEQKMHRKSLLDMEEIKRRGANMQAKISDMNEKNECLVEIKECLERLDLENSRRPTINRDMKAIFELVENISTGKIDINSDVIIRSFSKLAELFTDKGQRYSIESSSDFAEEDTDSN